MIRIPTGTLFSDKVHYTWKMSIEDQSHAQHHAIEPAQLSKSEILNAPYIQTPLESIHSSSNSEYQFNRFGAIYNQRSSFKAHVYIVASRYYFASRLGSTPQTVLDRFIMQRVSDNYCD